MNNEFDAQYFLNKFNVILEENDEEVVPYINGFYAIQHGGNSLGFSDIEYASKFEQYLRKKLDKFINQPNSDFLKNNIAYELNNILKLCGITGIKAVVKNKIIKYADECFYYAPITKSYMPQEIKSVKIGEDIIDLNELCIVFEHDV